MKIIVNSLRSYYMEEGIDGKETVNYDCDQKSVKGNFDYRSENVFKWDLCLEVDTNCDSSNEEESYFQEPMDLLFGGRNIEDILIERVFQFFIDLDSRCTLFAFHKGDETENH